MVKGERHFDIIESEEERARLWGAYVQELEQQVKDKAAEKDNERGPPCRPPGLRPRRVRRPPLVLTSCLSLL